jgi:hypothetical protein
MTNDFNDEMTNDEMTFNDLNDAHLPLIYSRLRAVEVFNKFSESPNIF